MCSENRARTDAALTSPGKLIMSAREDSLTPTSSPSPSNTPNPLKTYTPGAVAAATSMESNTPPSTRFYGIRSWMSQAFVASFMAGGVAGAVSRTVVSPLERLKILLQVQSGGNSEYKIGIWQALKKIWREEGMKGMMAGNGTNCIRIVPYSAVQFGSYNVYKPLVSLPLSVLEWAKGVARRSSSGSSSTDPTSSSTRSMNSSRNIISAIPGLGPGTPTTSPAI